MARTIEMRDDPQFPQLGTIADSTAMKDIFQHRLTDLGEGHLQIEEVRVKGIHFRPGEGCHVVYRLEIKDLQHGSSGRELFIGEIGAKGSAEFRYAESLKGTLCQPQFGSAVYLLADLDMVVWAFPNEPVLKHLPKLWDQQLFSMFVHEHWTDFHLPEAARLTDVRTDTIKYVPLHRCTLRHELLLDNQDKAIVYSKSLSDQANAEKIFNTMDALWQASVGQSGGFIIPEPFFFEADMKVVFVRGLEGENANDRLAVLDLERAGAEIGAALAKIHQCNIKGLPACVEGHILSQVAETGDMLEKLGQADHNRVAAIAKILRENIPA